MGIYMTSKIVNPVEFAKALADDTRQKIMAFCCCDERSVGEIVEHVSVTQPTVSHHLKRLTEAGLVDREQRGRWAYFSLNAEALRTLAALADLKGACC